MVRLLYLSCLFFQNWGGGGLCVWSKKHIKFSASFLWHTEINFLSGLCLNDIAYFIVLFGHVNQFSFYRAFVNLTWTRIFIISFVIISAKSLFGSFGI